MSPKVRRRQSVMLGSRTPVNASRKRRIEVWSNGSLNTHPPAVHGEITMHGTRKPPPIGMPPTNSPGADRTSDVQGNGLSVRVDLVGSHIVKTQTCKTTNDT